MPSLVFALIAVIGAAVQIRRRRGPDRRELPVDTLLVWWLVTAVGVGSIVGSLFHIFDGAQIAEQIGYTRGDGGFQFENAMGDMAIGVAAVLCRWFRGYFWLAVLIVVAIQFLGDAGGHIYFWLAEDDTEPDNVGLTLLFDFAIPIAAAILYTLSWRRGGDARPEREAVARTA
ncbi:MAG TPA: DUF6790 family protein [Thermoleophilaceae bacterium]|nr:DUF6790 family protein [Thermoleophilaceae bacterium]